MTDTDPEAPVLGRYGYPVDPALVDLTPDELDALNTATREAFARLMDESDRPPEDPRESDRVMDGVMDGAAKPRPPAECPTPLWVRPLHRSGVIPAAGSPAPIRCWRWSCESCGPRRRVEVLRQVRLGAQLAADDSNPLRFLTVTFPLETAATFDTAGVAEVNERFRRFVQALRRGGISIEYAKTLETTKRGRLHVHALVRGSYIPKCTKAGRRRHGLDPNSGACYCAGAGVACHADRCKDARSHNRPCVQSVAWSMGLGFVDVRKVKHAEHAAGYIAKYLTKASANLHHGRPWPKYARRYSASRRWSPLTLKQIHAAYIDRLRARGIIPEPAHEIVGWIRTDDPALIAAAARGIHRPGRHPPRLRPLPPAGAILDRTTGELLPVPF